MEWTKNTTFGGYDHPVMVHHRCHPHWVSTIDNMRLLHLLPTIVTFTFVLMVFCTPSMRYLFMGVIPLIWLVYLNVMVFTFAVEK